MTGGKFQKAVSLSLVVHRLTGGIKPMKLLYPSGAHILYEDAIKQINSFSAEVQNNVNLSTKNKSKRQPTHIIIDNSDGSQQTLTVEIQYIT